MKHAYLIIAHNNFYTLTRLLSMLDDERNDIFLHIDKRAKNVPFEKIKSSVTKSKLCFTKRISVFWGHSSQVDCEMLLLKSALKHGEYDYVHLLSGVDLPIKSQKYIDGFFERNKGNEFLQVGYAENHLYRLSKYDFTIKPGGKLKKYFFGNLSELLNNKLKVDRLKKYPDLKICKTANWFSVTGECAKYIVSQEKFIKKLTRHTVCADEMFLGTVIRNSPFWDKVYNKEPSWDGHMRFIDRINNVGSSPHTFTVEDKEKLCNSEMLFARKFDETVDRDIISFIYESYKQEK